MKFFIDIAAFELKKILGRKITVLSFIVMLILTLGLNLWSIPLYSVGLEGEQATIIAEDGDIDDDWSGLWEGLTISWIDDEGSLVEQKVSPWEYIQMQRTSAMKWSGKKLDDATIQALKDFIAEYGREESDGYLHGWNYRNYFWVWKTLSSMGLNPLHENTSEAAIKNYIERREWQELYSALQLTPEERAFWKNHGELEYPLIIAYTPAYRQILSCVRWIHIMLLLFVVLALCESFSIEHKERVRAIAQATKNAPVYSPLAKLAVGVAFTIVSALILYGVTFLIQFFIFGTDGFHTPIQQISGFVFSRLMVTAGEAVLIMCGTSILILVTVAVITMTISEWSRSGIAPVWLQFVMILGTMLFNRSIFYEKRQVAQIWQYFPIQRINDTLLYDERLVFIGGKVITAMHFSVILYVLLAAAFAALAIGHALICRRDR